MADSLSSVTGLSSGIDSKALVDQMMALERRPADRLQATIDANAKRTTALGQLQSGIDALKTAMKTLVDGTAFDSYSVTAAGAASSGRSLMTASAGAGAVPGSYQVKVLGLASTHKLTASVGQSSATAALGLTGTFELRRPDDSVLGSVTLDGTESLTTIRDRINTIGKTAKLQASIVSTKADGSDQRLVISSTQSGEAGRFTFVSTDIPDVPVDTDGDGIDDGTEPGPDPLAALGMGAPITQTGNDAKLEIDGVTVTRSTNTVTDALAGVTINLTAADQNATGTLTVDRLKGGATSAIKGFVDAYNAVRNFLKTQTATGGVLAGEALARTARGLLSDAIISEGDGLPAGLKTFGSVGISLTKEGTLSFDSARFDAAYADRLDELKGTLAARATALSDVADSLAKPLTGSIDKRETALSDLNARLTSRIDDIDARLEKKRAALLAQFAKFEASLGSINAMGKTLTAQLSGLTKSSDS